MAEHADFHQRPNDVNLAPGVWIEKNALGWSFVRSGGPGGQNVNKRATKAELRIHIDAIQGLDDQGRTRLRELAGHRLTQDDHVIIQCDTERSQRGNRREALERLRELVERASRTPRRRKRRRRTRASIERRLERKRRQAEKKTRRNWRPPDAR